MERKFCRSCENNARTKSKNFSSKVSKKWYIKENGNIQISARYSDHHQTWWSSTNLTKLKKTELLSKTDRNSVICRTSFSRRMTSIRKSLLSLWRRRRNRGSFAPGDSSNLVNSDVEKAKRRPNSSSQEEFLKADKETGKSLLSTSLIQKCEYVVPLNSLGGRGKD